MQDILVKAKLNNNNVSGDNICKGCQKPRCQVCNFLINSDTFYNNSNDRDFKVRKGTLDCNSSNVVYCLSCKTCSKKYVGSTTTPFRFRFNNYKSQFRTYCRQKEQGQGNLRSSDPQAGLFEHFLQEGHHGMDDWAFQLIDKSMSRDQVLQRESFWQYRLGTFLPVGLNERNVSM